MVNAFVVQFITGEPWYWQAAKPTKPRNVGKNAGNMGFSALVIK